MRANLTRGRAARGASLAAVVLATLAACRSRPVAGAACRAVDRLVCDGASSALVCQGAAAGATGGTWRPVACRGARGCARGGEVDDCDDTVAAEGDACPKSPPLDYACTPDRARALECDGGRFGLWRNCRGPEGCKVKGGRNIECDTTLALPGDPCGQAGTVSCSLDRRALLVCAGGTLTAATSCRGPRGCRAERDAHRVDCDDSLATEGDPCDKEGRIACAVDRGSELGCTNGKYERRRECRRSECRLEGTELYCD